MLKNLAQTTFQRATVGSDNDELNLTLSRMRSQINDMRILLREMNQEVTRLRAETREIAVLRAEVATLKASGFVGAPAGAPVTARPIQVPEAVLAAAEAVTATAPVQAAPVQAAPVQAAPVQAAPVLAAEAVAAPVLAAPAPGSISASIAAEAAGYVAPPASDLNPNGVNTNAAGVAFWGLLDNESSRARAAGKILIIDQPECISCGTCVEQTDAVFVLPDDSKAVARSQEGPMDAIQDAIDACPVTCIHWTDEPNKFEKLNDAAGAKL